MPLQDGNQACPKRIFGQAWLPIISFTDHPIEEAEGSFNLHLTAPARAAPDPLSLPLGAVLRSIIIAVRIDGTGIPGPFPAIKGVAVAVTVPVVPARERNPARRGGIFEEHRLKEVGQMAVTIAQPVAAFDDDSRRHEAVAVDEEAKQGGPRRGGALHGLARSVDGDAFEELKRRRRGDGELAVGAADRSGADVDGRGDDLAGGEGLHEDAGTDDVDDGIDGSDFMKMDLFG
jgi:hypothetical protein